MMSVSSVFFVVMFFDCRTDINSGEQREKEGLNEGNEQLKEVEGENERQRQSNTRSAAAHDIIVVEDKNEANQAQDNDVASGDVSEKTYKKRDWFEEKSKNLDRRKD